MEKRTFLAVALSLLILLLYPLVVSKLYPNANKKVTTQTSSIVVIEEATTPKQIAVERPKPRVESLEDELYEIETAKFKLAFSKIGGNIKEVFLKDYKKTLLQKNIAGVEEYINSTFAFKKIDNGVILTYRDNDWQVQKVYYINNSKNAIELELIFQNIGDKPAKIAPTLICNTIDLSASTAGANSREKSFWELSISLPDKVLRTNFSRINKKSGFIYPESFKWLGTRERYFCLIFKPSFHAKEGFARYINDNEIAIGLQANDFVVPGGETLSLLATIFVGPQDLSKLASLNQGFEKIVNFGFFDPISQGLLILLRSIHKVLPSWGLCIILLSVCIFACLYPFTLKSLRSMKQLQAVQPEMERLRKEYKDNPQKLNKEIMELYRKYKVNPFGGCLPMLLQIPVFFALYQALMRSIELKGTPFLWIKDLSEPDRLITLKQGLPFIGRDINILPILMIAAMALQQKFSTKGTVATGTAAEQQKMMAVLFPILFGFIFYNFPSGLVLYWFFYTLWTVISQWRMNIVRE